MWGGSRRDVAATPSSWLARALGAGWRKFWSNLDESFGVVYFFGRLPYMDSVPIRQVDFPGTRTSRSKFPSDPSKVAPIQAPLDPSQGAARVPLVCGAYRRCSSQTPVRHLLCTLLAGPLPTEPNYPSLAVMSRVEKPRRRAARAEKGDSAPNMCLAAY